VAVGKTTRELVFFRCTKALNTNGVKLKLKHLVLIIYSLCFFVSTIAVWYASPNIDSINGKDIFGVIISSFIAYIVVSNLESMNKISIPNFSAGSKFAIVASLILFVINQVPPFAILNKSLDAYLTHAAVLGFIGLLVSMIVIPACGFTGILLQKYLTRHS